MTTRPLFRLLLGVCLVTVITLPAGPGEARRGDLQQAIIDVQEQALSALVNIQPITETFTRGERRKQASVGSGFLIDLDGHIVTNYHVAGQARHLMVTLSNKERIEAELVGEDPLTDLAVIRIPPEKVAEYGLEPLSFGSSSNLKVGQFVMALGSPLALARTMTFGIVSNTERYLPEGMSLPTGERTGEFNTWIQTDAAINPGNSGGPLIDLTGRVVGVNARGAVFADNIGFAIPADTASVVVRDLIADGEVSRSYSGVQFQPLKDWEGLFGLDEPRGVLVANVEPGGPAAAAGVEAGDILTHIGEWTGTVRFDEELPGLYQMLANLPIGGAVTLQVLRRGDAEPVTMTMTTVAVGRLSGDRFEATAWGFTVKGITEQMVFELELVSGEGVLVEGVLVGGPAHVGKLRRYVVLEAIEGQRVTDLDRFKELYEQRGTGSTLLQTRRYESLGLVLLKFDGSADDGGTR
jgi:serine protease Do